MSEITIQVVCEAKKLHKQTCTLFSETPEHDQVQVLDSMVRFSSVQFIYFNIKLYNFFSIEEGKFWLKE